MDIQYIQITFRSKIASNYWHKFSTFIFVLKSFESCHNSSGQKRNDMWAVEDVRGGSELCSSLEIIIPY